MGHIKGFINSTDTSLKVEHKDVEKLLPASSNPKSFAKESVPFTDRAAKRKLAFY